MLVITLLIFVLAPRARAAVARGFKAVWCLGFSVGDSLKGGRMLNIAFVYGRSCYVLPVKIDLHVCASIYFHVEAVTSSEWHRNVDGSDCWAHLPLLSPPVCDITIRDIMW